MNGATMIEQRHWERPDQLQIVREGGWGYKYFRRADVERRIKEGWEVCRKDEKVMKESGAVDSTQNYRSLILMRMPQHMVDERNLFYVNKHKRRLRAAAKGAAVASAASRAATHENDDSHSLAGAVGKGLVLKQGVVTEEGLHHTDNVSIPIHTGSDEDVDQDDLKSVREQQLTDKEKEEVVLEKPSKKASKKK